ncbi:MAG: hypothetical protein JST85_16535 [Acidobacteria bacterium]|nr:hypothetical protein [Acidobacteriota bacterium]
MSRYFAIALLLISATAVCQAQTFGKTKMIDAKGKEVPVTLEFDKTGLSVKALKASVADVPYDSIDKLSYEMASRHRVKEGAVVMIASLGVGAVVMMTKSKNHWFYVDYKDADGKPKDLTLKLDKSEYENVLKTAKEMSGKDVEISTQKKDEKQDKKK